MDAGRVDFVDTEPRRDPVGKRVTKSARRRRPADRIKAEILARVDVFAEYRRIGVQFAGLGSAGGYRKCHAFNRDDGTPDDEPSASIRDAPGSDDHGHYVDHGRPAERGLSFIDFMIKHEGLNDFNGFVDEYAPRFGVAIFEGERTTTTPRAVRASVPIDDDDDDELPIPRGKASLGPNGRPGADVVFPYHRADGSVSYDVTRTPAKKFWQTPWTDGTRRPGAKMTGVDPLPYRLPAAWWRGWRPGRLSTSPRARKTPIDWRPSVGSRRRITAVAAWRARSGPNSPDGSGGPTSFSIPTTTTKDING